MASARNSASAAAAMLAYCWTAAAQPAPQTSQFIVATVQRSTSTGNPQTYRSGGFLRGNRYDLRKVTMLDLVQLAYGFESDRILGGPDWLEFDRFDIAAKADPSTLPQSLRFMLQSLLSERFNLVLHQEVRPVPAYVLKLGSTKPKLKAAEGTGNAECKPQQQPDSSAYTTYSCRHVTMAGFAQQLHAMAGDYIADPVVDATGLAGSWDFDLKWSHRSRRPLVGLERITLFNAIAQQLGLRLTLGSTPENVIVIDSVNEKPTENAPNASRLLPPRELQFEVASVKQSRPEVHDGYSGVTPGGAFEAHAESMRNLFATAWDIHWDHVDEMIVGMPKWMDSARYDILAKPPSVASAPPPPRFSFVDDDLRLMLRALLTERFKIRAHYENRPVSAYTLVAAKPRLTHANPSKRAGCKEAHTLENDPRDLNPRLSRLLECQSVTMAQFAHQLLSYSANDFTYAVEDATGISGKWDLRLSYSPTGDVRNPTRDLTVDGTSASDQNLGISLFDAVEKQLGLKLEKRKRMLPVLVIDHIEESPTEN